MKLIIEDDEGHKTVVPFVREEITIGRQEGNTIRLTERNVSRKHARLTRQNGHIVVEDLGSYNGIRINGEKIAAATHVNAGDLIQIGDYDLAIQTDQPQPTPPQPQHEDKTEIDSPVAMGSDDEPTDLSHKDASRESTAIIRVDQLEGNPNRAIEELDVSEAPKLIVISTEFAGREFACIRTEMKIGRTEENDISLEHRSLSRTHCKIARENNGDWRIIDLQSANGLKINGEPYAQATLAHGDVIELGHLKLRFVAAGKSARFAPASLPGPLKRLPLPVLVGGGAGIVAVLLIAVMFAASGPSEDETQPTASEVPTLAARAQPPAPDAPVQAEDVPQTPTPPDEPTVEAPPTFEKELAQAKSSMEDRKFEAAVAVLKKVKDPESGELTAEAQALSDRANLEIQAKARIAQASRDVTAGNLDAAEALLGEAAGTEAYAQDLQKVQAKLDKARSDEEAAASAPPPVQKNPVKTASIRPVKDPRDDAKKHYEEGMAVFKKRQLREAKSYFHKCVESDSGFAKCHMMLGSTYAQLKDLDEGAKYYRSFVKLAPADDPYVPKVRKLLEEYEASKQ